MKIIKTITMYVLLVILSLCTLFNISSKDIEVKAETTPSISIYKNNVSYADSIYILYSVEYENVDIDTYNVQMLFFDTYQTEYTFNNASYIANTVGTKQVDEEVCLIFYSKGLAAKQMTDDIYARAYVNIEGEEYYSEVSKYSVLEYAYTLMESPDISELYALFYKSMLKYGSYAQQVLNYKTDRLADSTYYKINVVNGALYDGFTYGRYQINEKISMIANEIDGSKFVNWTDSKGNVVSSDKIVELTVAGENTYTANYEEETYVIEEIKLISEEAYDVTSSTLEFPTTASFEYKGNTLTVPISFDTSTFIENQIGKQTLLGLITDSTILEEYNIQINKVILEVNVLPYTFSLSNDEYTIIKYYGTSDSEVIPSTYKNIDITNIGDYAFRDCESLTNITISSNVTRLMVSTFYNCTSLQNVYYEGTIKDWCSITFSGFYSNPMYYASHFYMRNSNNEWNEVTEIEIPTTITSIDDSQFYGFENVKKIIIPASVTSIGFSAFWNCTSLESIVIPNSVTSIESNAFSDCTSLTNVMFEEGSKLTSIGSGAFSICKSLKEIIIPSGVTSIGFSVFSYCISLTNVTFEEGSKLTSIESNAFSNCESLKEIIIPSGVTSIESNAFRVCTSLTNVTFEEESKLTSIESNAFENCTLLESIVIPNSVTSIGSGAFSICKSLKEIIIPSGVTSIESNAFRGCTSLTNVTFEEGSKLTSIGDSAFRNCTMLESIVISNSVTSIESNAFSDCTSLTNVTFEEESKLTSIGDSAFWNCESLKEIIIPLGVTSIESNAFYNCTSLTNVTFEEGSKLTSIERNSFRNCTMLESIVISNSVTSIERNAFYNCTSLTIYCEAISQPSGWDTDWNYSNRPVVWGYPEE